MGMECKERYAALLQESEMSLDLHCKNLILVISRTFKIERTTIFIFYFCVELVTQLNGPVLGVLKHYYITKRIRELLICNSRFLIHNLLNQLLYYTV